MRTRAFTVSLALLITTTGCYRTRIHSPRPVDTEEYSARQLFTLGGLVPLSRPAGAECTEGIATAQSKLAVLDVAIEVLLAVGGGVAGAAACSGNSDPNVRASCSASGAAVAPFLLGTRTVDYTCARSTAPLPLVPSVP